MMASALPEQDRADTIDVAFPIHGPTLPPDHAEALRQALCANSPWLATDPLAGIHPIKMFTGGGAAAMLSQRTRLLLRVARPRQEQLRSLEGTELNMLGHVLRLGVGRRRELLPHATLYASKVAADNDDEAAFMAMVGAELARMAIVAQQVCGRRQRMSAAERSLNTFSLMLHALAPEQSLRLQIRGLGPHRLLGCGIFVPHRSAAAA